MKGRTDRNWGIWLRDNRKAKQLKRYELAQKVGCDPSSITLMERGHLPRPDLAGRIGRALVGDPYKGQVMAGYCPPVYRRYLLEHLSR